MTTSMTLLFNSKLKLFFLTLFLIACAGYGQEYEGNDISRSVRFSGVNYLGYTKSCISTREFDLGTHCASPDIRFPSTNTEDVMEVLAILKIEEPHLIPSSKNNRFSPIVTVAKYGTGNSPSNIAFSPETQVNVVYSRYNEVRFYFDLKSVVHSSYLEGNGYKYYKMDLPVAAEGKTYKISPDRYTVTARNLSLRVKIVDQSSNQTIGFRTMHIPIINDDQEAFLINQKKILEDSSINLKFAQSAYQTCTSTGQDCDRNRDEYRRITLVGYSRNEKNGPYFLPAAQYSSQSDFKLRSFVILENTRDKLIGYSNIAWTADGNVYKDLSLRRSLLDQGYDIITEINNDNNEFGEDPYEIFLTDDDTHYGILNHLERKLEIVNTNSGEVVNSLSYTPYDDNDYHSMRIRGRHLEFISKTEEYNGDNDPLAHRFDDCISFTQIPEEDHRLLIENDNYVFKAGELTVWEKRPEHTEPKCHFPTSGQSNLAVGQELIQYNTILEANANKLTYLLNGDMVTIKDDGVLKVVRIDANGHFDPNNPANIVQTFGLQ